MLNAGFWGSRDFGGVLAGFCDLRGGGYLGIGMGGGGAVEELEGALFGGGVEGREEKRLKPGNVAKTAMEEN